MTAPLPSTSERPSDEEKPARKIDLNFTQVSASALAAITAAVLGSFVGAAGTVIGAALASVITTVTSTLYNHSLERSRERVRQLALKKTHQFPVQRTGSALPSQPQPAQQRVHQPAQQRAQQPAFDAPTDRIDLGAARRETAPAERTPLLRRVSLRWPAMVVGTAGAFMIAMVAIFGFEVASGQTLDGQPGRTSIQAALPGEPDDAGPAEPEPVAPAPSVEPSTEPEPSSAPESSSEQAPEESSSSTEPDQTDEPTETGSPDEGAEPEIPPVPVPGE